MKASFAASAVLAITLAAAAGSARAGTYVSVSVGTPAFGISIASPVYAPPPVVPVVVAAPIFVPPPVLVSPRVAIGAPVVVPVAVPYGYFRGAPHRKQGHRNAHRGWAPVAAYPYAR